MQEPYRALLARELAQDASAQPVEMLLNPLKPTVGLVGGSVETARSGPPRYDMHVQLRQRGDGQRVYGFSAFRHQEAASSHDPGGCHYNIRLSADDGPAVVGGETFCAKLLCSADGTRYTFCDDPSNFYSWPRELGAVIVSGENLSVLLPRVHPSGAAAQFRVLREDDGIIARFIAGQARQHLMILSGPWATKRSGGEVQLVYLNTDASQVHDVVFRAKETAGALAIQFRHPLSAFQAFGIALSLVHHAQVQHQQMERAQQLQQGAVMPPPQPAAAAAGGGVARGGAAAA